MKIEEALGLVEEIKNCSLPWDDVHWEALGMVINYVKDKLNEDFKDTWKPSDEKVMDIIEIFGRKLTIVEDNDTNTCKKCALVDICPSGILPCKDSVGNVNRRFEKVKE